MMGEEEVSTQCPYCFSPISFLCEIYSGAQSYVEDCEVCCKPIQVSFSPSEEEGIADISVRRLDE